MKALLIAALAFLPLGACTTMAPNTAQTATAGPAPNSNCFRSSQVSGYTLIDDHNVGIRVGANHNYILTTTWDTHQLNWTLNIALRSDSGWICTGNGLGVEIIGGRPPMTYPVSAITNAPPTQPQASPDQHGS